MGRTARERLAKLLDDAQASGAFSAQILAPADALQKAVTDLEWLTSAWGDGPPGTF
jgi:hypothetical protein